MYIQRTQMYLSKCGSKEFVAFLVIVSCLCIHILCQIISKFCEYNVSIIFNKYVYIQLFPSWFLFNKMFFLTRWMRYICKCEEVCGHRATDPIWWRKVGGGGGGQRQRCFNRASRGTDFWKPQKDYLSATEQEVSLEAFKEGGGKKNNP